jgi:hypothetical protein
VVETKRKSVKKEKKTEADHPGFSTDPFAAPKNSTKIKKSPSKKPKIEGNLYQN